MARNPLHGHAFLVPRRRPFTAKTMMTEHISLRVALLMAASFSSSAFGGASDLQESLPVRGTQAGLNGPNLMADSSFESLDPRVFSVVAPFRVATDSHAHGGKADLQASLSRSGHRIYARINAWKNTDYVSSLWLRGSGSGTFFVASPDFSRQLVALRVGASAEWRQFSLPWNSGEQTGVAIGFQDDISAEGTLYLDDFYTGLKNGHTIAFVAPPPDEPQPHAPPGFSLVFDDEFNDRRTIDVNNTQKDGYKWYVKGMWFPSTSPSMYDLLPSYKGASGVLEIKDAPVTMSWNFSTTFFDDSAPEGFRGTVFLPGKGIYYEARMACEDLAHIRTNGWAGFWSLTMPMASRPRNGNLPPWSMAVENTPMPGWPGKWETIENDIMEYNPSWGHPQQWDSTIHDWSSGSENGNIGNFNSVVYAPVGTDYTQWHTYGQLWIPATAANGWHGYRQVYFDGVPQQAICWIGNQISQTSQPAGSYLFSMCDGTPKSPPLWRNLMIGGAMGGTPNTFVDYVRVYAIDPPTSVKVVRQTRLPGTGQSDGW
jgi:hypothetical protein